MDTQTVADPGTVNLSTTLDPNTFNPASGGGTPNLNEPVETTDAPEPTLREVLEAESKRLRDEDDAKAKAETTDKAKKAADDAKAKVAEKEAADKSEEKPAKARDEGGKFAKTEPEAEGEKPEAADKSAAPKPASGQEGADRRQSEGQHREPPARFLPEARAKWANVPSEVKAEFHRVAQEVENELAKSKAGAERYEQFREYDEVASKHGRDLRESIHKLIRIEQHMDRDPVGALESVLREIGPRKPDGSPLSLYEVATVVLEAGPQASPQFAERQGSAEIQSLRNEFQAYMAQMHAERAQQTVGPVIQSFASAHPDYYALEPQISEVLQSGIIEKFYGTGLSVEQKLAEAYRMAGGSTPSRSDLSQALSPNSDARTERPVNPDAGNKSVRGAPLNGADTAVDDPETDVATLLRKELRKLSA